MIKKLFLFLFLTIPLSVYAGYNDIYVADIQYDWINKSAMEKEEMISEVHDIIFENPIEQRKDLKQLFKDKLKDKNHIKNYMAASAGYEEYENNYISAFYYKKKKYIYMYALQDKKDVTKAYYYDALGNLRYIDFINGEFPDYPYYTIQYSITGKPISAIYNISKDCQYLYKPNGDFEGVWYKHKLYNKINKVILTRTTY